MRKGKKLGQSGQTAVEYILMIVVIIFVATGVFKKIEEYLITNPDSMINLYLSSYKTAFGGAEGGFTGAYRFFNIRR